MDFQSAMETFAEAWVAANTGKVGPVGAGTLDLNKAAESIIHQQLGKGNSGVYSQTTQHHSSIENGGLDYPKIHSRSITPLSHSRDPGVVGAGAGMDLSPSSKRSKTGFSPIHGMGHFTSGRKSISGPHITELEPNTAALQYDPTHSTLSSSSAAALVGKSLPIHCVIEVSDKDTSCGSSPTSVSPADKTATGKIETGQSEGSGNGSTGGLLGSGVKVVEVDDFVIIPAGTPFQDVVTTVLTLLGYPKDIIQQAEGSIHLKNWRPLKLEQVCDSAHKTVGDIFNDLTNHAITLRVLVTRPKGGNTEDLKEKLLRLLLAQSSNILMGSGCPLDEATLGQLLKGQWPQNLAEDMKRRFDQWYQSHQQKLVGLEHHPSFNHNHSSSSSSSHLIASNNGNNGSPVTQSQHSHLVNGSSVRHHLLDKSLSYDEEGSTNHPVFHGLVTQKTRMRTSFDPEMELPRLQQWFQENPHPSRHQIQHYVRELNGLECRKDRKALDLNNVIYWFKNARAAQKRNELRYNSYSPSQPFSHHHIHSQNTVQTPLHTDGDDDREYLHSVSSCRDSSDDHDQEEMKDYHSRREEMDEDNQKSQLKHEEESCEMGGNKAAVIKEELDEDFISVDVELTDGGNVGRESPGENCNNNEPKDLSGKKSVDSSQSRNDQVEEKDDDNKDKRDKGKKGAHLITLRREEPIYVEGGSNSSPSVSSRSSPGMSPTHPYDFSGAPSMVSRFHPFFDHPFMAYRHFNSFNFGQNFPVSNGPDGQAAYENNLGLRKGVVQGGGKPSAGGMDSFRDFPNGITLVPTSRGADGPLIAGGGGDHVQRMRRDELFNPRSAASAELISSFINSNRGEMGLSPLSLGSHHQSPNSLALDERRKRNRTFIDPVTEVPRLEQWFTLNTHPSHNLILKYTEELNRMPYRQKFPKLEPKNVQFWFKNRRAKTKRLKMSI